MKGTDKQTSEKNILVVNDDGIDARGLHELVTALHEKSKAKVYVVAPDGQRSAASHGISLLTPIDAWPVDFQNAERAFATTGLPADCVAVGLKILRDLGIEVDMIFSGINHGSNVGTDIIYSGTVGAAMEGSIQGYPSAAVSVDSHKAEHFDYACALALDLVAKTGGKWDTDITININTPNLPYREIKGVKDTVIGEREYSNDIKLEKQTEGISSYRYAGEAVEYEGLPLDIDVIAIQNGYASITPLHRDMTAMNAKSEVKKWRVGR